jgi:hypothetical protein
MEGAYSLPAGTAVTFSIKYLSDRSLAVYYTFLFKLQFTVWTTRFRPVSSPHLNYGVCTVALSSIVTIFCH